MPDIGRDQAHAVAVMSFELSLYQRFRDERSLVAGAPHFFEDAGNFRDQFVRLNAHFLS